MSLAEWIKAEGITRAQAAVRLNLSPSYLTELCQGKRMASMSVAARIVAESAGRVGYADLASGAA